MAVYFLSINSGGKEFYSIKSFRDEFKKDKHLFEFLETEGYLLCYKDNDKSRRLGKVYPLRDFNVNIVWDALEKQIDGAYGN
jgi:hypothetical protein